MTTIHPGAPSGLWAPRSLRLLFGAMVVAVILLAIASQGARSTTDFSQQTDWIVVGILGLAVASIAGTVWVMSVRQTLRRRRERATRAAAALFAVPEVGGVNDERRAATPAMRHYHRSDCSMVRGKDAALVPIAEHHRVQRTPCAVCEP